MIPGLEQLSTVHATRGYDRAEKATAVRDDREMHRSSLARKVRASASATEAEFVRRARDTGALTDQQWGDIANDFVDSMGFTEASGKARCRWAAVDHGTSENGNHHIHLAVSLGVLTAELSNFAAGII